MNKNIGSRDRYVRLFIGIILLIISYYLKSAFLAIFGLFSILEALISWCLIYQIIGKNTCPVNKKSENKVLLFKTLVNGILILVAAILLNFIAVILGFMTWYDLLSDFNNSFYNMGIDNLIFLFVIYPFALGCIPTISNKISR